MATTRQPLDFTYERTAKHRRIVLNYDGETYRIAFTCDMQLRVALHDIGIDRETHSSLISKVRECIRQDAEADAYFSQLTDRAPDAWTGAHGIEPEAHGRILYGYDCDPDPPGVRSFWSGVGFFAAMGVGLAIVTGVSFLAWRSL